MNKKDKQWLYDDVWAMPLATAIQHSEDLEAIVSKTSEQMIFEEIINNRLEVEWQLHLVVDGER